MKKLISIIAAIGITFAAHSQTTNSNTNIFSGLTPIVGQGVTTTLGYLQDMQPYVANGNLLIGAGALKSGSHYGGYFDLQVPVSTNSWQVTYGTAVGYVNKSFYSASLPVSLGTTVNVPFVSSLIGPVYMYVESGPGWNFKSSQLMVQSFGGVKWIHAIPNTKWGVGASYGYGIISDVKDRQQQFGLEVTYKFN